MEHQWSKHSLNSKSTCSSSSVITPKVTPVSKPFTKSISGIASKDQISKGNRVGGNVALFILKVAALETTRRLSKAKCPFVWHGLQAFQMLCYPPFKWVQKWAPLKGLVHGMQMLSRPFLVISIATAFSDKNEIVGAANHRDESDANADTDKEETSSAQPGSHTTRNGEISSCQSSEDWLVKLNEELENQGINLPQRFNENELQRFYKAADGNLSFLISSIKKTINWRETYTILSQEELNRWSDVVFWHGYDMRHRPYLVVRLGLAYSTLPASDRPRFAQAIVSQMDHGVLQLAKDEYSCIMVIVDCEGLSPFRLPMQMLRSCSLLFQDHFPNCLGGLYVIRLPPVVRMVAQTFIKMLKPVTRQKLKFIGERYQETLSDYFQQLPSYLGSKCTCSICSTAIPSTQRVVEQSHLTTDTIPNDHSALPTHGLDSDIHHMNYERVLRGGMMGVLVFCVFVALVAGMFDPDS